MEITQKKDGAALVLALDGRLDTNTSPELSHAIADLEGIESLTFDFANLRYISSAGLRVLLIAHKQMTQAGGTLTVKNVNELNQEILDATGFSDILTIEND